MKKYIITLLTLILLFACFSCGVEPKNTSSDAVSTDGEQPTAPPEAGEIPAVPNKKTKIESVGNIEKEIVVSMFSELMDYINDLMNEEPREMIDHMGFTILGRITATAPAGSITINNVRVQYSTITASLETVDNDDLILKASSAVTVTKDGVSESKDVYAEISLITYECMIVMGEKIAELRNNDDKNNPPSVLFFLDDERLEEESEELEDLQEELTALAFALVFGLSKSTITFDDALITVPVFGGIKANIGINGDLCADISMGMDLEVSSACITIPKLSVEVSTGLFGLSGKLDIENFSVSVGDISYSRYFSFPEKTLNLRFESEMSFERLNVSAQNGDTIKSALALFNCDVVFGYSYYYTENMFSNESVETKSFYVKGPADLGMGLMVGENSIGFVSSVDIDLDSTQGISPESDLKLEPEAATINGRYYNPDQFKDVLLEVVSLYCD